MKYKFILEGLEFPMFKNQNDFRKPKCRTWRQILELQFDSELSRQEMLERKYEFVTYVSKKREIESRYGIKIPIQLGKLRWTIKEWQTN